MTPRALPSLAPAVAPVVAIALLIGACCGAAHAQATHFRFRGPYLSSYGEALSPAGDVDGDGHPDLLIGAPFKSLIEVRSGFDGRTLLHVEHSGPVSGSGFGRSVAGGGDADGDGTPDVAGTAGSLAPA